jgi:hypothetical protein
MPEVGITRPTIDNDNDDETGPTFANVSLHLWATGEQNILSRVLGWYA